MAYVSAFEHGFNGFECDVRKDTNGVLVCLHDSSVDSVSTTTGEINTLSYTGVNYISEIGMDTGTHLTTVGEAIGIAKTYKGFILFDMGKNIATVSEVVALCEEADFYSYGFFNVSTETDLANAPEYCLKVWGNDVFTHTESELNGYLTYGTENNCVRLLLGTLSEDQISLIKSKGFKILLNFQEDDLNRAITNAYLLNNVDYLLGDYVPYNAPTDKIKHLGQLDSSVSMTDFLDTLGKYSVRSFQLGASHPDNSIGVSMQCTAFTQATTNYIIVVGVALDNSSIVYKRSKFLGTWGSWVLLTDYQAFTDGTVITGASSLLNLIQTIMGSSKQTTIRVIIPNALIVSWYPTTCANWWGAILEISRQTPSDSFCTFKLSSRNYTKVAVVNGYYDGSHIGTDTTMS